MEKYKWVDEYLQKQTATEKVFQPAWQAYRYLLRGKMYAFIGVDDRNGRPVLTLKLEPAYSEMLRREYADIVAGHYMSKVHWSTVYLDGSVPKDVMAAMVRASPKRCFSPSAKKHRGK